MNTCTMIRFAYILPVTKHALKFATRLGVMGEHFQVVRFVGESAFSSFDGQTSQIIGCHRLRRNDSDQGPMTAPEFDVHTGSALVEPRQFAVDRHPKKARFVPFSKVAVQCQFQRKVSTATNAANDPLRTPA